MTPEDLRISKASLVLFDRKSFADSGKAKPLGTARRVINIGDQSRQKNEHNISKHGIA